MFAVEHLNVQSDRNPVAVLGDGACAPHRVLQCRGTDIDPGAPGGQRSFQRLVVTDASGELDVNIKRTHHIGEQLAVTAAAERRVEVH